MDAHDYASMACKDEAARQAAMRMFGAPEFVDRAGGGMAEYRRGHMGRVRARACWRPYTKETGTRDLCVAKASDLKYNIGE